MAKAKKKSPTNQTTASQAPRTVGDVRNMVQAQLEGLNAEAATMSDPIVAQVYLAALVAFRAAIDLIKHAQKAQPNAVENSELVQFLEFFLIVQTLTEQLQRIPCQVIDWKPRPPRPPAKRWKPSALQLASEFAIAVRDLAKDKADIEVRTSATRSRRRSATTQLVRQDPIEMIRYWYRELTDTLRDWIPNYRYPFVSPGHPMGNGWGNHDGLITQLLREFEDQMDNSGAETEHDHHLSKGALAVIRYLGRAGCFGDVRAQLIEIQTSLSNVEDWKMKKILADLTKRSLLGNSYHRSDRTSGYFLMPEGRKIFLSKSS